MRKSKINLFKVFCLFLVAQGCGNSSEKTMSSMDVAQWDSDTFEFLVEKCNLDTSYFYLGDEVVSGAKHQERLFSSPKQHIEYRIELRSEIIDEIDGAEIAFKKYFYLWESYGYTDDVFHILTDEDETYKLARENNLFTLSRGMDIKGAHDFFSETMGEGESNCFVDYSVIPGKIWVFSKIDITAGKIKTYRATLTK